ncbi:putative NADPH-dependent beta-ketoacyl reductase [Thozetella sp. PMI_491]|nr:putative NADPH-dependent beta-ketoacyl reductase [Thozetella sp. PMI_491]
MAEAQLHDFPSLFSLKGKVAVVTGGSRGLGLSSASAILQSGASLVFISSRKAAACDAAVKTLNALPNLAPGARAISVPADSSTLAGVQQLVAEVKKHTDHVDILMANAGATWGEYIDTHPDSAFAKVFDLNVRGVFNTIREFLPLLEKRGTVEDPSRVLITSSVAGLGIGTIGKQGTYGYSSSKAAVLHLGRNLAVELGPRHITVNSICPGFFPSKMSNGLLELSGGVDAIGNANPLRKLGKPEDMAGVVVYLTSRAGSHVNGAEIAVDGGAMWHRGELVTPGPKL